jgi:hypothetical protein
VKQVATVAHGEHCQSVGTTGRAYRRALQRIESDVDLRSAGADLFANVEHRRLVALAFANDNRAIDAQTIEGLAHGVHRRLVSGLFIAPPGQARTVERRRFGDSHCLES